MLLSRVTDCFILVDLFATCGLISGAIAAKDFTGRVAHGGTVGLGFDPWNPECAYACRSAAAGFLLDCPDSHQMVHGAMVHNMNTPLCYATNSFFMQTLAWCINTHCPEDTPISLLETWWEMNVAGRKDNQPLPSFSYQTALSRASEKPPTGVVNSTETLNRTSLVNEWFYSANYGALFAIKRNISVDNIYTQVLLCLVLVLTCTLGPILLSLFRFLPLPQSLVSKIYATLIDPPAFGTRHAVPVAFGMGIMPTRGQALFIAYIWAINIILSGPSYTIVSPNLWYEGSMAVAMSVANRVGMLSFGNLILAVFFSSRGNLLLYLTSWSRSTFLLVHRWLSFITIIQACLHSALYLYPQVKAGTHASEAAYPYWYWGIIATFALVLILPFSILPIRQKAYEFFLASHIVLTLLAMIGTFLHIYFRYYWQYAYEIWVAFALAIWGFDRFLHRPIKLVKNGVKKAFITVIDDDYLRIDIPGVSARGQAYLYFPIMTWRVWENHPFSVLPLSSVQTSQETAGSTPSEDLEKTKEEEGTREVSMIPSRARKGPTTSGVTFFIRRLGGMTQQLAAHAGSIRGVPALVESSYGPDMSLLRSPKNQPSIRYPNVLFIVGGVGITGVLPDLGRPFLSPRGTSKLYWAVRTESLVRAVEEYLSTSGRTRTSTSVSGERVWGNTYVQISIGERLPLEQLLENELLLSEEVQGGTTVIACGPPGMRDNVRLLVSKLGRRGAVVRFTEDQYGW